jgi:hypothetical protein
MNLIILSAIFTSVAIANDYSDKYFPVSEVEVKEMNKSVALSTIATINSLL